MPKRRDRAVQIGGWIRRHREKLGYDQRETAEILGISSAALCRIESGDHAPSPQTANMLSHLFDRQPTFFLDLGDFDLATFRATIARIRQAKRNR